MAKYGPELRAKIVAAYNADEKDETIRQMFGCPPVTILRFVRESGSKTKGERNKRQQIIKISLAHPRLGPTAIAKETGANKKYVQRVRKECGFKTIRKVNHVALTGAPTPDQSGLHSEV